MIPTPWLIAATKIALDLFLMVLGVLVLLMASEAVFAWLYEHDK